MKEYTLQELGLEQGATKEEIIEALYERLTADRYLATWDGETVAEVEGEEYYAPAHLVDLWEDIPLATEIVGWLLDDRWDAPTYEVGEIVRALASGDYADPATGVPRIIYTQDVNAFYEKWAPEIREIFSEMVDEKMVEPTADDLLQVLDGYMEPVVWPVWSHTVYRMMDAIENEGIDLDNIVM
ncbi:MAG: hypothetical protein D6790_06500 [Caldilineae bacterium]|nr:MAG: hypothetical protein D6790_06500 [Caldilineae bacterium]